MNSSATLTGCDDIIRRLREAIAEHPLSPIHGYAADIAALLDDLDFLRRTEEAQYESLMNTWKVLERFNAHPGRTDDPLHDCVEVALKARDDNIATLLDRLDAAEAENERLRMELAHEEQRVADMMADVNRVGHENEALREDAERLDSGCIRLVDRDDFGESVATVYAQVDLRAAIDAARREK